MKDGLRPLATLLVAVALYACSILTLKPVSLLKADSHSPAVKHVLSPLCLGLLGAKSLSTF